MSFGAPEWFWGFLLLPLLAALLVRGETRRVKLLRQLVAARLMPALAAAASPARRRVRFLLALLGLACVNAALTQPRWGYVIEENPYHGLDVMIAIDTSKSMLSTDVQPDRLSRAKFAAQDLLDAIGGNRAGLIAFAGTAFVQAPLTIDASAVLSCIQDLDTNTIPRGGTNISAAVHEAANAFGKGESSHRALILFTDGEDLEGDALQAAREAKGNFRVYTVGVGTRGGSLIPLPGEGGGTDFVKDDQGQFVKSHLDEERLRQIAEATGGFYVHLDNGPATMKAIVDQGLSKMTEHEFEARETKPIERYEWPLAAGMLLLVASVMIRERRRIRSAARMPKMAAAALALLLFLPLCGWGKNEGVNLYEQRNYKGAYDVFQNQLERNPGSDGLQFDEGTAAYKAGNYDRALESFGKVIGSEDPALRSQAEYNLGNTLVERGALQEKKEEKLKEWTDALQHYEQATKIQPNSQDAKYNADVVRKMIEELKKNPPPQQNQQQNQPQGQPQNQQQGQPQNQQQGQPQNQQQGQPQNQQQGQPQNQQQGQQQNQQQGQPQNQQQGQPQNQQQGQPQNQQQGQPQNQQQGQPQNQQQGQLQNQQQGQQQQNQPQQGQNQQQPNGGQGQPQSAQQQNGGAQPSGSPSPGQGGQDANSQQPQNAGNDQEANNNSGNPGSASPTPSRPKLSGEIKAQPSQEDQQSKDRADARAASTEADRTGEMTPSQARALIDSLRGEDEHVSLSPHETAAEATFKDW